MKKGGGIMEKQKSTNQALAIVIMLIITITSFIFQNLNTNIKY